MQDKTYAERRYGDLCQNPKISCRNCWLRNEAVFYTAIDDTAIMPKPENFEQKSPANERRRRRNYVKRGNGRFMPKPENFVQKPLAEERRRRKNYAK